MVYMWEGAYVYQTPSNTSQHAGPRRRQQHSSPTNPQGPQGYGQPQESEARPSEVPEG